MLFHRSSSNFKDNYRTGNLNVKFSVYKWILSTHTNTGSNGRSIVDM